MCLAAEGDNDNDIDIDSMEENDNNDDNDNNNNNDEGASSASLNLSVSMSMSQDTATDTVTGKTVASTSIQSTDATIVRRGDGSFRVKDPIKKAHGKSHGDGNGNGNGIGGDMNIMHMNPLSRHTLLGTGAGNPGAGAQTGLPSMPEEDTDGGTRTGTGTGRIKWCCGNLSWCPWKKRNELMWV